MPARQCPFCGKMISVTHSHCPFCREAVPPVPGSQAAVRHSVSFDSGGNRKLRQGLLYMLLAGVIQYFAGGYASPLKVPVHIQPVVTSYLVPLLFLSGLGL
ncbi:MAG: hypothetical protein KGL75_03920, partial [Acidobacteriota bacterium]|nr:hypothetical protein [Acidobacteriota bacterium]